MVFVVPVGDGNNTESLVMSVGDRDSEGPLNVPSEPRSRSG
jgi:hypothetical protein